MRNLNSKQAKKEIARLISGITSNSVFANKQFLNINNDDYDSENYYFSKLCFYSYQKDLIKLYENFGIAFYSVDESMQDLMNNKDEILEKYNLAYDDWQNAKQKEKEVA